MKGAARLINEASPTPTSLERIRKKIKEKIRISDVSSQYKNHKT